MLTLFCRLRLLDGKEATGKLDARFPGVAYRVAYAGALDYLPEMPENGTASDVELAFRIAARKNGATLEVERFGSYEARTSLIYKGEGTSGQPRLT